MKNDKKQIKTYDQFLNEELDQTTDNMEKTSQVYSKYKNRVLNMVDKEDISKSEENFENFVDALPDEEKSAVDMLRSLFSGEMIQISIEKLEQDKQRIEEQIKARMEEFKAIQDKLS